MIRLYSEKRIVFLARSTFTLCLPHPSMGGLAVEEHEHHTSQARSYIQGKVPSKYIWSVESDEVDEN